MYSDIDLIRLRIPELEKKTSATLALLNSNSAIG